MQRLHREVLPAIDRGDGERYAQLRCVEPATVTQWQRTSEVMKVLDGAKLTYVNFDHFQPSHAREIARHFRKRAKPPWAGEVQDEILAWVERCEQDELTVEDLRHALQNGHAADVATAKSYGLVTDLNELVAQGAKFKTIYADPPWQYANKATRSNVDKEYKSTMTVDEICAEPVASLVEDCAHLHLWTTNAFLFEAQKVIEAWGFEYKSCFVWVKPQMGIGNYWRVSHEFMLLGVRGGMRFRTRDQMSWMEIDRGKHSRKPKEIRQVIEKVSDGPFLELYGREPLDPPWTVYGNETELSYQTSIVPDWIGWAMWTRSARRRASCIASESRSGTASTSIISVPIKTASSDTAKNARWRFWSCSTTRRRRTGIGCGPANTCSKRSTSLDLAKRARAKTTTRTKCTGRKNSSGTSGQSPR